MAVRRIDRYEGERVTYHYRSHRTDRVAHETVEVHTFSRSRKVRGGIRYQWNA